jgi:VCBS repeat protein
MQLPLLLLSLAPAAQDTPDFPFTYSGMAFGNANGAAFLDHDADAWPDIYVHGTGRLHGNLEGQAYALVANLHDVLPTLGNRYGASAGDYDADGLPDLALEPRDDCFYLLKNLGGASFVEVASDPEVLLDPIACPIAAETFCWADVDDDLDLDLWAPFYGELPDRGNRFLENLGPTGPAGAYRFADHTLASGLGYPGNGAPRPEGAQFADVDRDGDVDGYTSATLFQNVSAPGVPLFRVLRPETGIAPLREIDEGLAFLDYDLDGDWDLLVATAGIGKVRLHENQGDGTFFRTELVIESPQLGASHGLSTEDWDQDGDIDACTTNVLRTNLLVETGERRMVVLPDVSGGASIAWADYDKDGDPDALTAGGALLRNDTYGPSTPPAEKHSLRVRVVRDSGLVARGLETEFGATVELRVHDDPRGFVRRRFVASSHGYLQQSEYALTMALPSAEARFDVVVDFPGLPVNRILRVDPSINPALGRLTLAELAERELTVFRSGRVHIDGVEHAPLSRFSPRLASSGAQLLAAPGQPLGEPVPAPEAGWFVGMELDTLGTTGAVRVAELVLDAQLAPAGPARCDSNVRFYDVTPGEPARLLHEERLATSERNHRSFFALDWLLKPGRVYRVLCRVTALRESPLVTTPGAALANRGALSGAETDLCADAAGLSAAVEPGTGFLELRYRVASAPGLRAR